MAHQEEASLTQMLSQAVVQQYGSRLHTENVQELQSLFIDEPVVQTLWVHAAAVQTLLLEQACPAPQVPQARVPPQPSEMVPQVLP